MRFKNIDLDNGDNIKILTIDGKFISATIENNKIISISGEVKEENILKFEKEQSLEKNKPQCKLCKINRR